MRNMHPADELAMIRTDIRRLRDREEFLRKGFLSLRFPTRGDEAVATVKIVKQRRFCQDKLPEHLRDDPDLWETKVIRHVHVDEAKNLAGRLPAFIASEMSDEVIERF